MCNEPPKIKPSNSAITGMPNSTTNHQPMPNRQRNTRANSARTPARPSVIEVIHKVVGRLLVALPALYAIARARARSESLATALSPPTGAAGQADVIR